MSNKLKRDVLTITKGKNGRFAEEMAAIRAHQERTGLTPAQIIANCVRSTIMPKPGKAKR